ncbi:hypothetical protein AU861_08525 [Salmonella enterica subsp. enterica serovar Infantis]|uniref:Uncharacterized protein n=3 Tax=root TaxID=1 RepID=A0A0M4R2T6_9CAUD|nr:hypothetical protein SEN5_47 [Salmonella phage SEN5]YP_009218813.1 hypothetical protein SEN4_47 [Salmonella phage SEN4]EAR6706627.1 hypothetical protein [Salmonella enterica]EBH3545266.1 hypothetical protein [Salmonella enterica subsp. enterica serovar Infantis]EBO2950160.1 hypothetical protein [Salmonella enterica subsp. enterica serovar Newport]EBV6515829.1 hypothetical protein [Salmonella enterica subsp. enterica serovar Emek]ECB7116673.1 hypothetical protein [Salmonella enterica subsp.
MNTIILAIALISGYLYVTRSVSARYIFKRSEGWDAYFYVAAWGVLFTLVAWMLCSFLSVLGLFRWAYNFLLAHDFIEQDSIKRVFPLSPTEQFKFADFKFAFFGVTSMFLAWAFGHLMRWYVCHDEDRRIDALVKAVHHDPLESLLIEAAVRKFPVIITLGSRKFYVGIVDCPKFEHGKADYLQLLPLLSGYRDKDTLTITVTTNYKRHYIDSGIVGGLNGGPLTLADFRTLVPKGEIEGISFFDTDTYSQFKAKEEVDRSGSTTLSPTFMPRGSGSLPSS